VGSNRAWALWPVLVAVVVAGGGPSALAAQERDELRLLRTRHYRIHTDLPAKEARDVPRFLEEMFASYARVFRYRDKGSGNLDVYVFKDRASFISFGRAHGLPGLTKSQGLFVPELNLMVCFGRGDDLVQVLAHEGTHQFITLVTKPTNRPPLWFHEGLASYFETVKWDRGKLIVGEVNRRYLAVLSQARQRGALIPLEQLLQAQSVTPLYYAEAWSFVHFLLNGLGGRNADVLNRYFVLIQKGEDPVEAFTEAFRAPLDKVQKAWVEYVDGLIATMPQRSGPGLRKPPHHERFHREDGFGAAFRRGMLTEASLYSRQILAHALLRTSPDYVRAAELMTALALEPQTKDIPVFDALRSEADARFMPGPVEYSKGVLTVEHLPPRFPTRSSTLSSQPLCRRMPLRFRERLPEVRWKNRRALRGPPVSLSVTTGTVAETCAHRRPRAQLLLGGWKARRSGLLAGSGLEGVELLGQP